jgi:putative NIF3 family GTP cyclohydrolase 1 type 2
MRAPISRRRFALMAGTAGVAPLGIGLPGVAGAEPLTAATVVRRIQTELGGDWPPTGPDGFKAGDPSTVVKEIATTAMATLDVLKQAVAANANLILTYEPTFYSRADVAVDSPPGRGGAAGGNDPVVKAKRDFIEKNGLVVFRLRDHWQTRKENDMVTGLASALGWSAHAVRNDAKNRAESSDGLYEIPPATAEASVDLIRSKLNLRAGLRVVGDRSASIRRVLLFPGSMTPATMWQRYSDVDMIVAGEVREWENTHYAADIFTTGEKRALVTTGRVVSEDPGMRACAEWLKTIVKEVPAKWIGVGDPYWRPA